MQQTTTKLDVPFVTTRPVTPLNEEKGGQEKEQRAVFYTN
jgi:hypothetical protein